ncbi:MAG: alpha-amylase family glycosyl hydrolase [Candidatus Competibacteraceae bacterium]
MIIYNLFPLLAGPFGRWEKHIARAAAMEFDWIFVNPVQQSGGSGSLYSIADYFQLDRRLVDPNDPRNPEQQLKEVIAAAEQRGIKMMVDLVINHCATDSTLVQQHPEWFEHEKDGSLAHPFCFEDNNTKKVVWGDLVSFDHQKTTDPAGLYAYLRRIVHYLLELGFKGFRCDAAYQIPGTLWKRLIKDVKKRCPEAVFAAETLGCTPTQTKQTAQAGFDYIFNSIKWWDLEGDWLLKQYNLTRKIAPSIGFPESHDTERLFAETNGNVAAMKQRYLLAALFSTGVMMPIGFEFGFRKPLHVVDSRPEDWEEPNVDLCDFITRVNTLKKNHAIFNQESPTRIVKTRNKGVLVLWKGVDDTDHEALLITNKDTQQPQTFQVDTLSALLGSGAPLQDVSPEQPLAAIPRPFTRKLEPAQLLVLVTD